MSLRMVMDLPMILLIQNRQHSSDDDHDSRDDVSEQGEDGEQEEDLHS